MTGKLNLIGKKYGNLTVVEDLGIQKRFTMWRCRCECGKEVEFPTYLLTRGLARSCGCMPKRKCDSESINEFTEENMRTPQGLVACSWEHDDCFANKLNGHCIALNNTTFPNRKECPFYKRENEEADE